MQLSDHDLSQLKKEDLLKLPEEVLRDLPIRLLDDLIEARERLNRNSHNSSRPPSSETPWEKQRTAVDCPDGFEETGEAESGDETQTEPPENSDRKSEEVGRTRTDEDHKPGKQPGAEGFGRQQPLSVTAQDDCPLPSSAPARRPLNADAKKPTLIPVSS